VFFNNIFVILIEICIVSAECDFSAPDFILELLRQELEFKILGDFCQHSDSGNKLGWWFRMLLHMATG